MKRFKLVLSCLLLSIFFTDCIKENRDTLNFIQSSHHGDLIYECRYNGSIVYKSSASANDAATYIHSKKGDQIGVCNYAAGEIDVICGRLKKCEIIYCIEDNIWGYEAEDKYGLTE